VGIRVLTISRNALYYLYKNRHWTDMRPF
jgi:uncharacterized protein YbdZ (MbtH family)